MQIFKTTVAASASSLALKTYGGPDFEYQKTKKMKELKKDLERSFIRGEKKDDTSGTQGKHRRTTGGVTEGILSSGGLVQDQNGLLSAPDLEAFIREGFTYGSSTKILMCGGNTLSAVSEIARGQLRLTMGEKNYGLAINEWNSPHGTVRIVKNPTFVADQAAEAILLDMECFKYRYLQGRDFFVQTNVQQPDMDGKIDQVIGEVGLERRTMAQNAWLRGVGA